MCNQVGRQQLRNGREIGCPKRSDAGLSPRAALYLVFTAYDMKLHEVCCAAYKQRRPRNDSHHVTTLDEMLFEQSFFRDQYEFLDTVHLRDRSRRHAPIERKSPARFLYS